MSAGADASAARRGALRWLLRETMGTAVVAVILVMSVGRWDWVGGWALTAIYAVWVAGTAILVMPLHPALLAERATTRPVHGWDKAILGTMGLLTMGAYVVAGLDVRHGWGPAMPPPLQWVGGVAALGGYLLVAFSMRANAFFATVARIQTDRGQKVATGGPYRWVRHPGYVGAATFAAAAPALLGSWPAFALGVLTALLLVIRTVMEDRMLLAALEGYAEYAARVRWRLVPGVW